MGRLPKTRPEFWRAKIAGNRDRDAGKVAQLVEHGWRVMTVWQCSLADSKTVLGNVEDFLRGERIVAEA